MALRDQPYIPLYWKDFISDEKLRACSASATGVYIFLMCILHRSKNYGSMELCKDFDITKGLTKQQQNLESVIEVLGAHANSLAKQLPFNRETIAEALEELYYYDVIRLDGTTLFQPRMVKDGEISEKRATAGRRAMKARYKDDTEDSVCCNKTPNKEITKDVTNAQQNTANANANIYNIKESGKEEVLGEGKTEPANTNETKKTRRFVPPTIEEVAAYCTERNNGINPEGFINFYEANGWVQGKQGKPVKDWKACVRAWETNGINNRNEHGRTETETEPRKLSGVQAASPEKKERRSTL